MDLDTPKSPAPRSPGPAMLSRKSSSRYSLTGSAKKPATTPHRHEGRECHNYIAREARERGLNISRPSSVASTTSPESQAPDSAERQRPGFATQTFASHRRTQSSLAVSKHPNAKARLHRSNSSIANLRDPPETPQYNPRLYRAKTTTPITSASARRNRERSPSMREPMGLKEAFELAAQQHQDRQDNIARSISSSSGVSSPVEIDEAINMISAFQRANAELHSNGGYFQGSPSPAPRAPRVQSASPSGHSPKSYLGSNDDGRDLTRHLQQLGRHQLARRASASLLNGINTKPDEIHLAVDHDLSIRDNMRSTTPTAGRNGPNPWDAPLLNQDEPIPSIEGESAFDGERPTPARRTITWSPEKSMNWNLDEFTAGDLQISDSPRIVASRGRQENPDFRRSNDRLDRLRDRETEVAGMSFSERPATKLDEIRARERKNSSPRALANSKLDEIRARNSEARSASPELVRRAIKDEYEDSSWPLNKIRRAMDEPLGNSFDSIDSIEGDFVKIEHSPKDAEFMALKNRIEERSIGRRASHDLLRRLSEATSNAQPEDDPEVDAAKNDREVAHDIKEEKEGEEPVKEKSSPELEHIKSQIREGKAFKDRPANGPEGIRRVQSTDSFLDKLSSNSETDPTDRIEGEMSLFEPVDNASERTSSHVPSEFGEEDTPRATRVDPLTMPTPRITGAYVETPLTLLKTKEGRGSWRLFSFAKDAKSLGGSRARSPHNKINGQKDAKGQGSSGRRSVSMPAMRRSKSRSRSRKPPINSAKRASVKEDLAAILKEQQIEDSTLDDFDGILEKTECDEDELEDEVNSTLLKVEDKSVSFDTAASNRELEQLERVLHGIRDSKHGIARLEDQVAHSEKASIKPVPTKEASAKPATAVSSDKIILSLPRFFEHDSHRPTRFGFLAIVFVAWLFLEGLFTHAYSGPQYACTPATPCEWSPNEPYFPYSMPFMLDEWTTGGQGRSLVWKIGEDLGDTVADVSDWITRTDFSKQDQRYMGVWERKRHRRRLRKHGLVPKWVEPKEWNKGRYAAYHQRREQLLQGQGGQRSATVNDDGRYDYGYPQVDDEKMDADETI